METQSPGYYRDLADMARRDAARETGRRGRAREEAEAEKKRIDEGFRDQVRERNAEYRRQAEATDRLAQESLPSEETRTVTEIRREYRDLLNQVDVSISREHVLADADRGRIMESLAAERNKLSMRKAELDVARRKASWWKWFQPVEENDEVLRLGALVEAAEREVAYLDKPITRDDERRANPVTEAERLQRNALRANAEAMVQRYPWLLRPGSIDA